MELLGVEGGHAPFPPTFERKFPSIYISIKNLLLALKLIYLAPFSQTIAKLTHETKKKKKNYQIMSQEYQEKKHLAKHLDNLQIWTTRKIYKTIHIFR